MKNDIKIVILGRTDSGKTNFVQKWTKNDFNEKYKSTIVSEFGFKIFEKEGKFYRIQLWDLAGQDRNAKLTEIFARDAHGYIIKSNAGNPQIREE